MSNHLHLIVSAKDSNLSDILRDFKKFTSKQIITAIENNPGESRKEWMLNIFRQQGSKNSRNSEYQFWRQSLSRTDAGIIKLRNYTAQLLFFKRLIIFIKMP